MTIDQMSAALKSVGACFAVTTAKTILPNDRDTRACYHIHPDCSYPHEMHIERVFSQAQFKDWIRTMKAVKRCTSQEEAFPMWEAYNGRWD
jgi:hypothetical protein